MGANDWQVNGNVYKAPTQGRWVPRRPIDVQGDNRPIYSEVRSFELRWRIFSYEDWSELQFFFDQVLSTGSHVSRLPTYPLTTGAAYGFTEYSGTHWSEPQIGPFFETFPTQAVLIIGNIVVE